MRYDKIIIVGSNTVACNCLDIVCAEATDCEVFVIETSDNQLSMLRTRCDKKNVRYESIFEKDHIRKKLEEETEHVKSLIISANNRYIFKESLIEKANVDIINFHYALLPQYRGINIPSWVIYNNEPYTGVTWHYVTAQIDHGNILSQRRIEINPKTTAYDIIREGMRVSRDSFLEFFKEMLVHRVEGSSVDWGDSEYIYLSKNLPNDGVINVHSDSIDTIDRTLRAYDHHGLSVMPPLQILFDDHKFLVNAYSICEGASDNEKHLVFENNSLLINDMNKRIMIKLLDSSPY